jgi:hypothetical protein
MNLFEYFNHSDQSSGTLQAQNSLLKIIADVGEIGRKNVVGLDGIVEICNDKQHAFNAKLAALPHDVYVSPAELERFKRGILDAMQNANMPPEILTKIKDNIESVFTKSKKIGDLVVNLQKPMALYFKTMAKLLAEQAAKKAIEVSKQIVSTAKEENHDVKTITTNLHRVISVVPNMDTAPIDMSYNHEVFKSTPTLDRNKKRTEDEESAEIFGPIAKPTQPNVVGRPGKGPSEKPDRLKRRVKRAVITDVNNKIDSATAMEVEKGLSDASYKEGKAVASEYLAAFTKTYIAPITDKPPPKKDKDDDKLPEEDHSVNVTEWERIKTKVLSLDDQNIKELKGALIGAVNNSPDPELKDFVIRKMQNLSEQEFDTTVFVALPADINQLNEDRYRKFAELVDTAEKAAKLYSLASTDDLDNNTAATTVQLINDFPHTFANLLSRLQSNAGNNYFFR